MLTARPSRPAAYGASPPPMNLTKPYDADATGFSTGETVITAWVVIVLFTPMKMPEMITAGISTARSVVQRLLGAETAGDPGGDQHRHRGDHQVAGEQQRDL